MISNATYTSDINYWKYSHSKIVIATLSRALSGLMWAIVIYFGWISGQSNIVRRILTSKTYDIIVKFLLPSYLAHVAIIVWLTAYSRSESLDPGPVLTQFIGKGLALAPISLFVGFVLHITVEVPFMKLLKSILISKK